MLQENPGKLDNNQLITKAQQNHIQLDTFKGIYFHDLLNAEKAALSVKKNILNDINSRINNSPDFLMMGLQIADIIVFKNIVTVSFSPKTQALIESGAGKMMTDATGKALAVAFDSKTGKIIEQARQVDVSFLAKSTNLVSIVVSASHIIAGWDNAKTLKRIEGKIDKLIEARKYDQDAELQALYESIKEFLHSHSPDSFHMGYDLRYKLKQLRCSFLNEVKGNLSLLSSPDKMGMERYFTFKSTMTGNIESALRAQEDLMIRARLAIALETTVAASMNEALIFKGETLPGIKTQVDVIRNLISEREKWMTDIKKDEQQIITDLSNLCESFSDSLGLESSQVLVKDQIELKELA